MSAWNTDAPNGETFAEIVKHSVEGDESNEEKTEEVAPLAPAAPVEIAEEEFPELPHVEESTTEEDASLLAATKGIDDALAASREEEEISVPAPSAPSAAPIEVATPTQEPIVVKEQEEEQVPEITFDPSDVLASSLSSAFSPPPPPTPQNEASHTNGTITPYPSAALPDHSAPSPNSSLPTSPSIDIGGSPDPTLLTGNPDSWKEELDARTLKWKAENTVARDKAEKKRAEWEAKRDEERKEELKRKKEGKGKSAERVESEEEKAKSGGLPAKGVVEKELGLDAGSVGLEVKGTVEGEEEERWTKVGEAWNGVHEKKVYGDAKVENGQIVETVDPSIASDPTPSSSLPLTSKSLDTPPNPSSSSSLLQPLTPTPSAPSDLPISHYLTTPGGNPPSLTLALFTSQYLPPRRRILLGLACFGINILLPFIGGMMAGFGEITAKLLQDAARDTFFGFRGRGVGGVGLGGGKRLNETEREVVREGLVENPMRRAFP